MLRSLFFLSVLKGYQGQGCFFITGCTAQSAAVLAAHVCYLNPGNFMTLARRNKDESITMLPKFFELENRLGNTFTSNEIEFLKLI